MDINCDCCELYCREGTRYTHIVRQDRQDVSAEQSDQKVRDRTLVLSTEEVLRLCADCTAVFSRKTVERLIRQVPFSTAYIKHN